MSVLADHQVIECAVPWVKRAEGFVKSAYEDTEGYLTIGYGHLIDARKGGEISLEHAEIILHSDLEIAIEHVNNWLGKNWRIPRSMTVPRETALIEMAFQLGGAGIQGFKKTRAALMQEDYGTAAAEMLDSKWHAQTPKRCQRLSEQVATGEYVA